MVKVIKDNGQPWTWKFTCEEQSCNSELEAEAGEIKKRAFGNDEDGERWMAWYAKCPLCGRDNIVPNDSINAAFWRTRNTFAQPE